MTLLLIAIFLVPLIWRMSTNYKQGVYWAVFLLTSLTSYLVIETSGALPNFTIHRLILLTTIAFGVSKNGILHKLGTARFATVLIIYAIVNIVPLIFSMDPVMSVKSYLSFTIETILFYLVLCASIDTPEEGRAVIKSGALALVTVAVLALIERYTGFNPVDSFLPGYVRKAQYAGDILATFPHRILLGTAMAAGWPLALAFAQTEPRRKWLWWPGVVILLGACYLSFSRGPWIASILGGTVMFFSGGANIRKQSFVILALVAIALSLRPGVLDTLVTRVDETRDINSFKGQTYQYRWELWNVAWDKISRDPVRMLFGFGQGSTEVMKFERTLSYTGETTELWSWDNHYAATMMETGVVGLVTFIGTYAFFIVNMFRAYRCIEPRQKIFAAATIASVLSILFMMTNVEMFAPQLNYLSWALIGACFRIQGSETGEVAHVGAA